MTIRLERRHYSDTCLRTFGRSYGRIEATPTLASLFTKVGKLRIVRVHIRDS